MAENCAESLRRILCCWNSAPKLNTNVIGNVAVRIFWNDLTFLYGLQAVAPQSIVIPLGEMLLHSVYDQIIFMAVLLDNADGWLEVV